MRHDINDTDRLDFVIKHCEISSDYKIPSQCDRAFIDAMIDANDLLQCAKDKERDKALELQQTLKDNQENY